jgi:phage terminase large subunit-like protein
MKRYNLNPKQHETLTASETERLYAYVGGIRSGKTITGAHWALHNIIHQPEIKGGIFSNTVSQLNTATLSEFIGVLEAYGLYKGEHYVANKDPERYFGYKSKFEKHNGVWSFMNGAQVITFSIETMIRGIELGWCWGDEVQDAAIDSLNIVMGRMSGAKFPRTLWTMTPPMDNPDIDELIWGEKHIAHTIGTTYDNSANLPEGYIEQLEKTYDSLTFKR